MKKLDLLVIKTFLGPFFITFFVVIFVFLMQFFWLYIDDIVGKGLEVWIIIKLILYVSASLIPISLPLAILLSSIMTMGNLGENSELTAMKSSGISLERIMKPLIILMVFISIGAFLFTNYAIPYCNFKSKNLLYNISRAKPALNIKPGIFNTLIPGYSIRVEEKFGENDNSLKNVLIYIYDKGYDNMRRIIAKEGKMKMHKDMLIFSLYDGYSYEEHQANTPEEKRTLPFSKTKFKTQIMNIDMSSLSKEDITKELYSNNYSMLNTSQLLTRIDSFNSSYKKQVKYFSDVNYSNFKLKTLKKPIKDSIPITNIFAVFNGTTSLKDEVLRLSANHLRKIYKNIKDENQSIYRRNVIKAKHQLEIHKKLALSTVCLIMFFVGAPLGAIIRKGGMGLPVVIATVIFLFYNIMLNAGERMGRELILIPFWARWYPSIILAIVGIFLTKKATSDSSIFIVERYLRPFIKLLSLLKRTKPNDK